MQSDIFLWYSIVPEFHLSGIGTDRTHVSTFFLHSINFRQCTDKIRLCVHCVLLISPPHYPNLYAYREVADERYIHIHIPAICCIYIMRQWVVKKCAILASMDTFKVSPPKTRKIVKENIRPWDMYRPKNLEIYY